MRYFTMHTALVCLFCLGVADASVPAKRQQNEPRVVRLPLYRNQIPDPIAHDRLRLAKRGGIVQGNLDNQKTLYFLDVSLGSPPQKLRLHLDTGSSDLWVNSLDSNLCQSQKGICDKSGTYTANASSTYNYLSSDFTISYVDGSTASGDYVTDTFRLGDMELPKLQFGIGYTSSSSQGILGIGYPTNEVQVATEPQKEAYKNLPARLRADGKIASNTYSIWLDDLNSTTGSLLFGGIDRSQYRGDLVTVPILKSGSIFREFFVTMTGLKLGSQDLASSSAGDRPVAVLLDTGSSLTYLPAKLVKSIYEQVNATWVPESQAAVVPCSAGSRKDDVTFVFSEPASIKVPMSELVLPLNVGQDGEPARFRDGRPACLFGISPSPETGVKVLGDTFLRSAYIVYDIDRNQISLAQSNFDAKSKGADVVEITADEKELPGAIVAPKPVTAQTGPPIERSSSESMAAAALKPAETMVFALVAAAVAVILGGLD